MQIALGMAIKDDHIGIDTSCNIEDYMGDFAVVDFHFRRRAYNYINPLSL